MEDDFEDIRDRLLFCYIFLTAFLRWHCCQPLAYSIVVDLPRTVQVLSYTFALVIIVHKPSLRSKPAQGCPDKSLRPPLILAFLKGVAQGWNVRVERLCLDIVGCQLHVNCVSLH